MKTFLTLAAGACTLAAAGQAHATAFVAAGDGFLVPLGVNTQTSTATVATTGAIQNLTFTLDLLVHTSARDLTASVTHNGITATLFSGLNCCQGLLGNYNFSSTAATPLSDAANLLFYAPGTYSFTYSTPGSFIGAEAAGDWKLTVADSRALNSGVLSGWNVSGQTAPAVPEPASWAMMIVGFAAVGGAMRHRRRTHTTLAYAA